MNVSLMLRSAMPALLFVALPALAAADLKQGKLLHDEKCAACHSKQQGGDGSRIYLRTDRLVRDREALARRVAVCNKMTGAGLRPEQEADIAAYLDQRYYKFEH
ncbi:MAG: cytochrome c [Bacteroidota bacterium]